MAARRVWGEASIVSEGDAVSNYSTGPISERSESYWDGAGIQEGALGSASGTTLRLPHASFGKRFEERRRLFAFVSVGTLIIMSRDQAWEGGVPLDVIDLADFPIPPTGSDAAIATTVTSLMVTTNILATGYVLLSAPATGRWIYVEGEPSDERGVWDPA